MDNRVALILPKDMSPESVAKTFTAYLLGALFDGQPNNGPFDHNNGKWTLDYGNNFWFHIDDGGAFLNCRYDSQRPTLEAMKTLFMIRYGNTE